MNYDVTFFIKKFEAIPEKRFTVETFVEKKFFKQTKYCAQGFCLPKKTTNKMWMQNKGVGRFSMPVGAELMSLIVLFGGSNFSTVEASEKIASINNGFDKRYQQPTPKQRILAALYDIRDILNKEQKAEVSDTRDDHSSNEAGKTKTIIKYVSVPTSITEQSKELILS